jgi:hypothetical protein
MIDESLVRAAVARYILAHQGAKAADQEIINQLKAEFLWTDDLFALFDEYEKSRDRYPTFESFFPKITEHFTQAASHVDVKIAQFEAVRPKVISMTPINGS